LLIFNKNLPLHLVVKKIAAEMSVHVRQQIKEAAKM
jgi:hypothetical protein